MFGLGANYDLVKPYDFALGLFKWRGLSLGSGFIFNTNTINAESAISPDSTTTSVQFNGGSFLTLTASTDNTKAKLKIVDSSFVIPIDLMTSVQLLWFLNLGFGVGADLNFASTKISMSAASDLGVSSSTDTITSTPGSASLNIGDSKGIGDIIVPRLATSIGLNVAILKLDFPVSYYPTTKAFAFGFTGGIVW
jgi:hypothetical protein